MKAACCLLIAEGQGRYGKSSAAWLCPHPWHFTIMSTRPLHSSLPDIVYCLLLHKNNTLLTQLIEFLHISAPSKVKAVEEKVIAAAGLNRRTLPGRGSPFSTRTAPYHSIPRCLRYTKMCGLFTMPTHFF